MVFISRIKICCSTNFILFTILSRQTFWFLFLKVPWSSFSYGAIKTNMSHIKRRVRLLILLSSYALFLSAANSKWKILLKSCGSLNIVIGMICINLINESDSARCSFFYAIISCLTKTGFCCLYIIVLCKFIFFIIGVIEY